jgi:hypothetical protein
MAKKGIVAFINKAIRKILGVKLALILKDLIYILPIYIEYLIIYIR